ELTDENQLEKALNSPGDQQGESQADVVLSELSQKLMRVLRKADKKAENKPELKQKLQELENTWGVEAKSLHQHLKKLGPRQASAFIRQHGGMLDQLEEVKLLVGSERLPIISEHEDEIRERRQSYGNHQRPEDYLDSFNQFVREQLNQSAAMSVVVNKPRNLTREQLREVKLLLDNHGYSEAKLQSAVRNQTNQDIAASIIGHIRRAALGEPLKPFEQRQLTYEVIIDRETVNQLPAFQGGAKQLDKILGDQLDTVLDELGDAMWPEQTA
ncbi:unnamed protein product, partial [Ectocarpus sp. 12 AP-2014]